MVIFFHLWIKILEEILVRFHRKKVCPTGFLVFHLNFLVFPTLSFWTHLRNQKRQLTWKELAGNGAMMLLQYLKSILHVSRNPDTSDRILHIRSMFLFANYGSICLWSLDHLLCVFLNGVSFSSLFFAGLQFDCFVIM